MLVPIFTHIYRLTEQAARPKKMPEDEKKKKAEFRKKVRISPLQGFDHAFFCPFISLNVLSYQTNYIVV